MSDFNKIDLETEKLFFKDYFEFGSHRYNLFVETMKEKFKKLNNLRDKKLLFIEINSYLNQTLEHFGAYLYGLNQARERKIALIRTLVTYKPTDGNIKKLIDGKRNNEIKLLFGLNNIYKKRLKISTKDRREFIDAFLKNIKQLSKDQHENHKIYNKAKHGNNIVSSIKAIKPDSTAKTDSVTVLNDDHRYPNVVPYSEDQFFVMCENILVVKNQMNEIICAYLAKYNPDAATELGIN